MKEAKLESNKSEKSRFAKKQKTKLPDLQNFEPSLCVSIAKSKNSGGISIVNSKNGKRLAFSESILKSLSYPDTIQIGYGDGIIAISKSLGEIHSNYSLSKKMVYNSGLVRYITDRYKLDYSARTSISFPILEIDENVENPVVFIDMAIENDFDNETIEAKEETTQNNEGEI